MDKTKVHTDAQKSSKGKAFDLLDYIGKIGVYQVTLLLMLGTMEFFGADSLAINFTAGDMDHWCLVEPIQEFSHAQQKYIAIPYENKINDKDGYEKCHKFNLPWSTYTEDEFHNWNRMAMTSHRNLTGCDGQWVYDQSEFYSTIVSRWDLVCDQAWLTSMVSTIFMAGRLVGAITCGFASDWFGRLMGMLLFNVIRFAGALLSLYAGSYGAFATGRFVVAVGATGANLCAYVMTCEVIGNRYRAWYGSLWQCLFALGYATLPCYAYFIRDDKKLQALLTWPILVFFLIVLLTPESPRWLLSKGNEHAAEKVIQFIAECNNRDVPENIDFQTMQQNMEKIAEAKKAMSEGKFTDLFIYPNMRKKTIIVWFNWFCNSFVYYGLSLNTATLPGNLYVTNFLYGISEIPANLFGIYLMNKIGRKWTIVVSLLFGGGCSFLVVIFILFEVPGQAITTFAVLGKMGIVISFTTGYVYAVEIFPTPVRSIGIGSASMCARIGGMIAPFMGDPLITLWEPLPSLIFGAFATASGLSFLYLPETLNKPLPSTMQESESFGKKKKRMNSRGSRRVAPQNREISSGGVECEGHHQSSNTHSNGQQSPNVPSNGPPASVVSCYNVDKGSGFPDEHNNKVLNGSESLNAPNDVHSNGSHSLDVPSNRVDDAPDSPIAPSNGANNASQSPNDPNDNSDNNGPGSMNVLSNSVNNESQSLKVLSNVLNSGSKSATATGNDCSSSPKSNSTNIGVVHCGFHAKLEGSIVLHVHNTSGIKSPSQDDIDVKSQSNVLDINVPIESQSITLSCDTPTESHANISDGLGNRDDNNIFYIQTQNRNSSDKN